MNRSAYEKIISAGLSLTVALSAFSGCAYIDGPAGTKEETSVIDETQSMVSSEEEPATVTDEIVISAVEEPKKDMEVTLSATEIIQGNYLAIFVKNFDASETVYKDFLGYERGFVPYGDGYISLLPVKVAAKPGKYVLDITFGNKLFTREINVIKGDYEKQYLEVSGDTLSETLENDDANAEYNRVITPIRRTVTPEKYWEGEFISPLEKTHKVTTTFGTFRTFSNGAQEYHNAIDYAATGGTPVYATNSGKVLYSGFLSLTGNTVLIDHGLGVLSWHYHMNERTVETGDAVKKGDQIGTVGTTGLSTGNHLHFGMSIDGIFVDPDSFIGSEPDLGFWEAGEEQ